jgi:membrane protein DedA with SNARE-associated domain
MPPELALYITKYGYVAIFSLVFLQEIGAPNPVPNEVVLLFSGYLAYAGTLSFPLVFLAAVLGDIIGTSLLYFVFYFFGSRLVEKAARWLPIAKIEKLKKKIIEKEKTGIFLGRLIPYVRGYVSIAAGLIKIPPRIFLTTVAGSAILWSGGYVIAGRIFGKEYDGIAARLGSGTTIIVFVVIVVLVFWFFRRKRNKKTSVDVL